MFTKLKSSVFVSTCLLVVLLASSTPGKFGYSNSEKHRSGGDLSLTGRAAVLAAIALINAAGDSGQQLSAGSLTVMLGDGSINVETDPKSSERFKGNSADKTGTQPGEDTTDPRMNLGPGSLDPVTDGEAGALGMLAGSLIHEYTHLYNPAAGKKEMWPRIAQARILCAIACYLSELPNPPQADIAALCEDFWHSVDQATMSSTRGAYGKSTAEVLALIGDCPCCPPRTASSPPPSPDLLAALSFVPGGFADQYGSSMPVDTTGYYPKFSFLADETAIFDVRYWRPSDGAYVAVELPLSIWPTAIGVDGIDTVYLAGMSSTGQPTIHKYSFSYVGDNVTAIGPTPVFVTNKLAVISDLLFVDFNGVEKLYGLDGFNGKIGALDLVTGAVQILTSQTIDPLMANWKSMLVSYDSAANDFFIELSRHLPSSNFYGWDDQFYLLTDTGFDGTIDASVTILGQNHCFAD